MPIDNEARQHSLDEVVVQLAVDSQVSLANFEDLTHHLDEVHAQLRCQLALPYALDRVVRSVKDVRLELRVEKVAQEVLRT